MLVFRYSSISLKSSGLHSTADYSIRKRTDLLLKVLERRKLHAMPTAAYYPDTALLTKLDSATFWNVLKTVIHSVIATTECFEAEVTCHQDGVEETVRAGFLPLEQEERRAYGLDLVTWLKQSSEGCEFFLILCTDCTDQVESQKIKFRFGHEAAQWFLELTESEFQNLQVALRNNSLPETLFRKDDGVHTGRSHYLAQAVA
jgi:hypothetical protein